MFKWTQSHFVINIFTFSSSCLVSWNFDITCSVVKILLSYKMNEREGAVHTPIFQSLRVCRFSSSRSEPLDSYSSYLYDGILLNLSKTSEKSRWEKSRMLQMNPPYRITFMPARKPSQTGLLFTHKNGDFSARRRLAARLSLMWRITYRIGVYATPDSFSCRYENLAAIG